MVDSQLVLFTFGLPLWGQHSISKSRLVVIGINAPVLASTVGGPQDTM